jgi:hypothetical protein
MSARLFSRAFGAAQLLTIAWAVPTFADWYDTGVPVCVEPGPRTLYDVATDDAGGILFAWDDNRITNSTGVFVQRLTVDGDLPPGWSVGGVPVSVGYEWGPEGILSDGFGGAFVAWMNDRIESQPPHWERRDIHLSHLLADGSLDPAWPVGGVVCTAQSMQSGAKLAPDGAGGVFVAWVADPDLGGDTHIFVQHVRPGGTIWPGWPVDGLSIVSPDVPGSQSDPRVLSDGVGGVFVAFDDLRAGNTADSWRVYLTRLTAEGTLSPGWIMNGNPVCAGLGLAVQPRIAPDASGGVFVIWQDERNHEPTQLYGMCILADGSEAPGWEHNGVRLGPTPGQQFEHAITADGGGGAFIAWTDFGTARPSEIRVQRVTAGGEPAPGWPGSGQLVATQRAWQMRAGLAVDGAGGVFVSWTRAEVGAESNTTIGATGFFVQHLGPDGSRRPGWDDAGRMFASTDTVNASCIVPSGTSSAILAWVSHSRIFAVRLVDGPTSPFRNGNPGPQTIVLENATPNPARQQFTVGFTLPDATPAMIELFDVSGRRVASRSVGAMGAGHHVVDFGMHEHAPGMYVLVLKRAGSALARRVAIVE